MPVKQDGTLHAATLKSRQVPDDEQVDAPGAPRARFIGVAPDLKGWDTPCRILQVHDASTGRQVNDAVDVGTITITIEPLAVLQELSDDGRVLDEKVEANHGQLNVDYYDGYFLDVVGVTPPGVPTSEHTGGADFADQTSGDPQSHLHTFPAAAPEVPLAPGEPALHALAGAGDHGEPLSDEEKEQRALEAQESRDHAAELSALGAGGALPPEDTADRDREANFTRVLAAELAATPDDLEGALARTEEATGLKVTAAEAEPPEVV